MTVLEDFEKWMKEKIDFNRYDEVGRVLIMAQAYLESLKKKHDTEKWQPYYKSSRNGWNNK